MRHLTIATPGMTPDPFAGLTPAQIEAGTRRLLADIAILDQILAEVTA